jgi:hypothetical protein
LLQCFDSTFFFVVQGTLYRVVDPAGGKVSLNPSVEGMWEMFVEPSVQFLNLSR